MTLKIKSTNRISIDKEEALKEILKEKMVTLTVLVPESLRANFKVQTIRNKTNVTTVIVNYKCCCMNIKISIRGVINKGKERIIRNKIN